MISTIALTEGSELLVDVPVDRLDGPDVKWYWVDISAPSESELAVLSDHYHFHPLAIEDCLHYNERPKVDYYDHYNFLVLSALDLATSATVNLDLFVGKNFVVSFHKVELPEVVAVREKLTSNTSGWGEGHLYVTYLIFDKIVDQYFPAVYKIEDSLEGLVVQAGGSVGQDLISTVFTLRESLLRLRHTINSMKELLYRILNSGHLEDLRGSKLYFNDIYDHLLRLSDMVDSCREMTADMRDSYVSVNSHQMNRIMTTLTVITSVFIPLTFIVGVYGMNFRYMPELRWRFGYFGVLGLMVAIGLTMVLWFRAKGWLRIYK